MTITVQAKNRTTLRKGLGALRREGLIPGMVSGKGFKGVEISIPALEFDRVRHRLSQTTLIDVVVDGGTPLKALLYHVQLEPKSNKPIHLEFHQVNMEDKIKVEIAIHTEGSAPAVSDLGGTLVVNHPMVEVRTDPAHLVSSFHVDISPLVTFEDHITAGDLKLPEGVELLLDPETILVSVLRPSVEVEEEETSTAAEPALAAE